MSDLEKIQAGAAEDLAKVDQKIKDEVDKEFPYLTPQARQAIINSRLEIIKGPPTGQIIKGDFGDNASKKVKGDLFE